MRKFKFLLLIVLLVLVGCGTKNTSSTNTTSIPTTTETVIPTTTETIVPTTTETIVPTTTETVVPTTITETVVPTTITETIVPTTTTTIPDVSIFDIPGCTKIFQVANASINTNHKVCGVVVAVNSKSFLIYDETAFILIYLNESHEYEIGDLVTVEGNISKYGGHNQFTKTAEVSFISRDNKCVFVPKTMTGIDCDNYLASNTIGDFIEMEGKLSISGSFYNLTVTGANKAICSIAYPLDTDTAKLSKLDGKKIIVKGYMIGVTGSNNQYANLIMTSCEAVGGDDPIETTTTPTTTTPTITTTPTTTTPIIDVNGYYKNALGLNGSSLKAALNLIIKNNKKCSYDSLKTYLPMTDRDPSNSRNVILMYTGRSQAVSTFGSSGDNWNREHTWPQSHGNFGTGNGIGTDLHHLRPTDASVNSIRGNLDFGIVDTHSDSNIAGGKSEYATNSYCYIANGYFEPRDEVKGDVARMIFYVAVRYEDNGSDLEVVNGKTSGSTGNGKLGNLKVLLQWNKSDPVDDFEAKRNETIYSIQGNRNPFVDNPQFADLIWGMSNLSNEEKVIEYNFVVINVPYLKKEKETLLA